MKKLLCIILATLMLMLPACGTTPATTTLAETTPTPTTPTVTTPVVTTPVTTPICTTPVVTTPVDTAPIDDTLADQAYRTPELAPFDTSLKAELASAWLAQYGWEIRWYDEENITTRHSGLRYYGTYNDYLIFYSPCAVTLPYLLAYRDGVFCPLEDVFPNEAWRSAICTRVWAYHYTVEEAILTRADLDDPYVFGALDLSDPGVCPHAGTPHLEGYEAHVFIGNYNGYDAFLAKTPMEGYWIFVIGGSSFLWGEYVVVLLKGEETILLDRAFERNLVTYEDVRKIAYYCYGETGPKAFPDPIMPILYQATGKTCYTWSELVSSQ